MIKVVIIGAGKIAEKFHLPAWKKLKNVKVVGIVDTNLKKAAKISKKFKVKNFSKNLKTILKKTEVDAVDICSSNNSHEKLILDALKNKFHVICEKPFVINHKVLKKIIKISKKNKLICLSAQHQRFREESKKLKKIILEKKLGKIYSIHINSKYNYSHALKNVGFIKKSYSGGGPVIDLGSHFFDLVLWLLDNPKPTTVNAFTSNNLSLSLVKSKKINSEINVEDYAKGMIRFGRDIILTFEFSYLLNSHRKRSEDLTIYGTKSNIVWPKLYTSKLKNKKTLKIKVHEKKKASVMMLENFIKHIKHGNYNNGDLILTNNAIKIISLLYKSAKRRKEIFF